MKKILTTFKSFINEKFNIDNNYKFDKKNLNNLIKNARKWSLQDFIEEYIDMNDISTLGVVYNINKGDEVELVRKVRDSKGKEVYNNGMIVYAPYKKVIADKDYGSKVWDFIKDNTKELEVEAIVAYNKNLNVKKPKLSGKTIKGYHASPYKFEIFKYNVNSTSGQLGAETGFFFFKDKKYAEYYSDVIKENKGKSYLYECTIKLGETIEAKGVDVGTNWNRFSWLLQMNNEGYDTVIIKDADTGYGITDEIIVFDDDNIHIDNVIKNE